MPSFEDLILINFDQIRVLTLTRECSAHKSKQIRSLLKSSIILNMHFASFAWRPS